MTSVATVVTVHPFERAGLGKAPFKCVGNHQSKFQACPGAPVQPGSSCDFCGTGIMDVYVIRSADGKRFKVGCDCVAKTYRECATSDAQKLAAQVDAYRRKANRAKAHAKAATVAASIEAQLGDDAVRAALAAKPHPTAWAAAKGQTLLDYVTWMHKHSGAKGRAKLAKLLSSNA